MDYLSDVMKAAVWGEVPPQVPKWNTWLHRNLSETHCQECLKLDKCWFSKEKTPKWPHHPFCHCVLEDIPYNDVLTKSSAECAYSKFDPYLFNTKKTYSHNKEILFNQWGYTVTEAKWLQEEVTKQGLKKYTAGDYMLGKLDEKGQRIGIRVEIPRRDKVGSVSFITGWMVYPNGQIKLVTPYGGR